MDNEWKDVYVFLSAANYVDCLLFHTDQDPEELIYDIVTGLQRYDYVEITLPDGKVVDMNTYRIDEHLRWSYKPNFNYDSGTILRQLIFYV